jgi:hypothetical protein
MLTCTYSAQLGYLITKAGGFFKREGPGSVLHAFDQAIGNLLVTAIQEQRSVFHIAGILLSGTQTHAWSRAALNLVLQAGSGAVGEEAVLASAQ